MFLIYVPTRLYLYYALRVMQSYYGQMAVQNLCDLLTLVVVDNLR